MRARRGEERCPQPSTTTMPTWRATPKQLPPPGLCTGAARPQQRLRDSGWGPAGTFLGGAEQLGTGRRGAARPPRAGGEPRRGRLSLPPAPATFLPGTSNTWEPLGGGGRPRRGGTAGPPPSSPGDGQTSHRRRKKRKRRRRKRGGAAPPARGAPAGPGGGQGAPHRRPRSTGQGRRVPVRAVPPHKGRSPGGAMRALTGGGRTLQMPVCSAMGRILWMKAKGSANSSQLGSKTGHSGGGRNSAMARPGPRRHHGHHHHHQHRTILRQPPPPTGRARPAPGGGGGAG